MTFESAIGSLTAGKAAKRASWRGYVKREDIACDTTAFAQWVASHPYSIGDKVSNDGSYYICKTAHTSAASFSSTNWIAVSDNGYYLTFVEREDPESGIGGDDVTSYRFTFSPSVSGSSVAYTCTAAPVTDTSVTPATHTLEVDALLMTSLLASDWTTGNTADFESARSGAGTRW